MKTFQEKGQHPEIGWEPCRPQWTRGIWFRFSLSGFSLFPKHHAMQRRLTLSSKPLTASSPYAALHESAISACFFVYSFHTTYSLRPTRLTNHWLSAPKMRPCSTTSRGRRTQGKTKDGNLGNQLRVFCPVRTVQATPSLWYEYFVVSLSRRARRPKVKKER